MHTLSPPLAENRILLHSVSWETFNRLLIETGEHRGQRFAYSQGVLEIMSPLGIHENNNRFIDDIIRVISDELDINLKKFGSLTLKLDKVQKGVEPDSCYYIQSEPLVRSKQNIDLAVDPPPDLVLEIDITSGSLDKLPIYANLGVGEVWRYDGYQLSVFSLDPSSGFYHRLDQSLIFPFLPLAKIPLLIQRNGEIGETAALKEFRQWLRESEW